MGRVVGIGVVLFALAVGFVALNQGEEVAALIAAFRSESLFGKIAWAIVVLIPFVVLFFAVWLTDTVVRQRRTTQALTRRLDGVRQGVKGLSQAQLDAETAVAHLTRTDPEDSISAIQQRLTEAQRFALVQHSRNEVGDLQTRVDQLSALQQALKERLTPVLEKRRSIEQIFLELDSRQNDIDRSLAEIASGDDAVALEIRINNLGDFVKRSAARCLDIERASEIVSSVKGEVATLQSRLVPFAATEDGITRRLADVRAAADKLGTEIDALQYAPQGGLSENVQKLADDKQRLDSSVNELNGQFYKLANLHKDVTALMANFAHVLDVLGIAGGDGGPADIDARIKTLETFIEGTQAHIDDIEHRLVTFGQLKAKLMDLHTRLMPLESEKGGVLGLIGEVARIRDRLAVRIKYIEEGDEGNLTERVKKLADTKRELEDRVSALADQFSKLATIRHDIAGLFEKLSSAVNASAN